MARRNIGVAIGLPEPYLSQLQGWRELLGDPAATSIVPHVTLLPPTAVPDRALPDIHDHLESVAAGVQPFAVHLRGSATFRPVSPVVFVPLVAGISDCERLERAVRSGPLDRVVRFPYHPHVTVAHHLADEAMDRAFEELSGFDATFEVREFWLYMHTGAEGWQPVRSHPLGG